MIRIDGPWVAINRWDAFTDDELRRIGLTMSGELGIEAATALQLREPPEEGGEGGAT